MTKNYIIVGVLMFLNYFSYSQTNIDPQNYLPTISPVSPEAASLGKYGEIPLNLGTCRLGYNIPIYNISAGGTKFPLSLAYNYGGFMPEQTPSMTGLGWTSFFGGSIVRKLNGKEDELNTIGYMALAGRLNDYPTAVQSEKDFIIHKAGDKSWDTEPDEFIINTGSISGSFYLGENNVPIFKINKNYKVDLLPYTQKINGFVVTDDTGVKYKFDRAEQAQYYTYESLGGVSFIITTEYNSSWMLTEISFPNSTEQITFDYSSYTSNPEVRTKFDKVKEGSGSLCTNSTYTDVNLYENVSQVLTRIDFPSGYVTFNTTNKANYEGIVLDDISIFDSHNKPISKYNFNYFNADKFYHVLTSIEKETLNNSEDYYTFEYYDLNSLPNSKSYVSDLWGFYNSGLNYLSDFNKGRYGALKKIHYPTKGFTEIEYEANEVAITGAPTCDYSPNKEHTVSNLVEEDTNGVERTITETITIDKAQVIYVSLSLYTTHAEQDADVQIFAPGTPSSSPCPGIPSFYQNNFYLAISGEDEYESDKDEEGVLSKNSGDYIYVKPGVYTLTTNVFSTTTDRARAKINVEYSENLLSNFVGGIRVSNTKDCANDGNPCIEKSIKYINADNSSSGLLLSNPKYLASSIELTGNLSGHCHQKTYAHRSVIPLTSYRGSHVLYNRVETQLLSNGLNNGKVVSYFNGEKNYSISSPYSIKDYKDWKKGHLEKQEVFKYENGQYILIKETKNTFEEVNFGSTSLLPKTISITAIRNRYSYLESGSAQGLTMFLDTRDYLSVEINQSSNLYHNIISNEKIFNEGLPLETTTTYSYDSPQGQLKEKEISTSADTDLTVTKLTYPYDENTAISNALAAKNMLSEVIESQNYRKVNSVESLLSTQRNNYKDWGNNQILPDSVQTSKGSNALDDRIIYHDYDDKGNPLEVSKKNGSHIYYIWGYNDQYPIAKLDNFSSSDITTTIQNNINAVVNASNSDMNTTTENTLRSALATLRNSVPNALVTSYTYDPLIGVTSVTDPRGYTIYYEYDEFNRLKRVKDADNNIVSQNEYHYKD